jgi:hypothetical protein
VVQTVLFCLAFGHDAKDLHLAYVNDELNFTTDCVSVEGCSYDLLSCQFLDSLNLRDVTLVSLVAMSGDMVCQADQYRSCNPGSQKHRLQSESGLTQTSVLTMHDI